MDRLKSPELNEDLLREAIAALDAQKLPRDIAVYIPADRVDPESRIRRKKMDGRTWE